MRSVTLLPRAAALRPYVKLIWCFEADAVDELGFPERIAPDGIVELVLHYRGRTEVRFANESFSSLPRGAAVCQTDRYLEIRPSGPVGFISVRFQPWGALHFFQPPVEELANLIVPVDAMWSEDRDELVDRIAAAGCLRERADIVEGFLLRRLARFGKDDVEAPLRAVWRQGGKVRIPALCAELGVSQRTARRLFNRAVGMPPKRYARLVRFLTACSVLRGADWRSLSEIGYRCGYYDHAHFDREFKALSGMSPGQFVMSSRVSFLEID